MRIGGNIKLGNSEVTINDVATNNNKLNSLIKKQFVENLNLNAGDTYQLNLPSNTLFVEPLIASEGSQVSGGQFLTPGAGFSYFVNNDLNSTYSGIWISCLENGLVRISDYRHCGAIVTGFRVWYIDI